MDAGNLAIVLSPPLLRQAKANVATPKVSLDYNTLVSLANTKFDTITFMIQHATEIFTPIPAFTPATLPNAASQSGTSAGGGGGASLQGGSGSLTDSGSHSRPGSCTLDAVNGGNPAGGDDSAAPGADDVILKEGSLSYKRERRSRPVQKWVILRKGLLTMAGSKGGDDTENFSLAGAKVLEGGGSTAFIGASRDFSFTIKTAGAQPRDFIFVAKTVDELASWLETARASL